MEIDISSKHNQIVVLNCVEVAILIRQKTLKMVTLAVLFVYIMLKGSIHQENLKIVNISASNIRIHKYIKQTIVELNRNKQQSSNSWRIQCPKQQITEAEANKETSDLNNTIGFLREGNGNPLQYSCVENPTDGGAW